MSAMLNNPRHAERDNQNSLRKFPFSDAASCTNGSCTIVPGAIVDAQLYIPGREPGRVWLSSVGDGGVLRFSDAGGEIAMTSAPAAPDTAVPVVFTGDGGPCPGGVVVFGRESDVLALRAYGGQAFTADQTELAPAAVAWPGLPGVCGFRLDDGHVVYGKVRMRGENGCVVSTYTEGGSSYLRISAVGRTIEPTSTTGFITQVVATSDNYHFVVSPRSENGQVVDITAAGLALIQDDGIVADREDLCAQVRRTLRTGAPGRTAVDGSCICADEDINVYAITLLDDAGNPVPDADNNKIPAMQGEKLGDLGRVYIPAKPGFRFTGYFDSDGRRYYGPDGRGSRVFTAGADVTVSAGFIPDRSEALIRFDGYGTLHLSAPDTLDYANPIRISGRDNPVPTVQGISPAAVKAGGDEAVAEAIMHPSTPAGEVHIGLRGFGKVSML